MMMMMMMICHDGFEWKKKENFIEMMINFKNSFLWEKPLRRRTAFQVCLLFTMIFFFVQKKEVSLRHHSLEKLKKSKSSKLKFGLAIGLWFVCLQDIITIDLQLYSNIEASIIPQQEAVLLAS